MKPAYFHISADAARPCSSSSSTTVWTPIILCVLLLLLQQPRVVVWFEAAIHPMEQALKSNSDIFLLDPLSKKTISQFEYKHIYCLHQMLSSHKSHAQIHKPSTTDSYNYCTILRNSSSSPSELPTHEWLHNHTWKFTIAADKCLWRPKSCLEKKKKKNSQAASFAASRLAPMTHSFYYCSYPFANTKSFHSKLLVHNAVLHQKILNRVLRHDSKSSKELTWGLSLSLSLSLYLERP